MASSPTFNPNVVEENFSAITRIKTAACSYAAPLLDRATQGLYPPGSTFKVVTAAAALDSGAVKPDLRVHRPGLLRGVRQARLERGQPGGRPGGLRQGDRRPGARALDQLGLLQHRQEDRRREDPRLREAVRLRGVARPRGARGRAERRAGSTGSTRSSGRGIPSTRSIPAGSPSGRSGCSSRRSRWRWSRQPSRTEASSCNRTSRLGARAERRRRRAGEAAQGPTRDLARGPREELTQMMESVVTGRHGDEPPDPALPSRRQDRDRGDRRRRASTSRGSSRSRRPRRRRSPSRSRSRTRPVSAATTAGPIAKSLMEAILAEKANT